MEKVRFATIGSSGICERFLEALAGYDGAELVATYSRNAQRAREFGQAHGASLFFDSLDKLGACADVDAVYIASPNAVHHTQALALAGAGKHVLVEKSLASNERQAHEVFSAAREGGVVAMEAMRNLHVPAFGAIEREIAELGDIRSASIRFAKITSRMARLRAGERLNVFDPHLAEGALMDIGVYCVEPAVALFGAPAEVRAMAVTSPVPGCDADDPCGVVDLSGEVLLGYGDKVVCLSYGKVVDDVLRSQVAGERGTLTWQDTSGPNDLRVHWHAGSAMVYRVEASVGDPVPCAPTPANDMVCELDDFCRAVQGDAQALAGVARWEDVTIRSLAVMDEVRRQVGVRFPADLA